MMIDRWTFLLAFSCFALFLFGAECGGVVEVRAEGVVCGGFVVVSIEVGQQRVEIIWADVPGSVRFATRVPVYSVPYFYYLYVPRQMTVALSTVATVEVEVPCSLASTHSSLQTSFRKNYRYTGTSQYR
jgi:hypothetical protein